MAAAAAYVSSSASATAAWIGGQVTVYEFALPARNRAGNPCGPASPGTTPLVVGDEAVVGFESRACPGIDVGRVHGALEVARQADKAGAERTILFHPPLSGHDHFDMTAHDNFLPASSRTWRSRRRSSARCGNRGTAGAGLRSADWGR